MGLRRADASTTTVRDQFLWLKRRGRFAIDIAFLLSVFLVGLQAGHLRRRERHQVGCEIVLA